MYYFAYINTIRSSSALGRKRLIIIMELFAGSGIHSTTLKNVLENYTSAECIVVTIDVIPLVSTQGRPPTF